MGNEFSWPCTDRKERARRIQESKFESWLTEDGEPRETLNIENRNTSQVLKNKREFLSPSYVRNNTAYSTNSPTIDQPYDSQSVSSMADRGPRIVIRCEDISDFKAFMDDVGNSYDYVLSLQSQSQFTVVVDDDTDSYCNASISSATNNSPPSAGIFTSVRWEGGQSEI